MLNLKEEILNVWVLMKKVFIAGYFISKFPTICILEKRFWKILLCCQENVLCVIDALMNIMKHYHQKKNPLAS